MKWAIILFLPFLLISQDSVYTFTAEEVVIMHNGIRELQIADSLNQEIIENFKNQICIYVSQLEQDSVIIDLQEQKVNELGVQIELYKEKLPKWYDHKSIWYTFGILTVLVVKVLLVV